jgi:hypothetical protein
MKCEMASWHNSVARLFLLSDAVMSAWSDSLAMPSNLPSIFFTASLPWRFTALLPSAFQPPILKKGFVHPKGRLLLPRSPAAGFG